jgi:large conductance mechanosensitive channel
MIREFREFIMRGNVMDMAIGIIIGGAFGGIVTSLVNDVIMPPIGLLLAGIDFKNLSIVLKEGVAATDSAPAVKPVLLNYGSFINVLINFVIIAFVIFSLVKGLNKLKRKPLPPAPGPATTKPCGQCLETVHIDAKRCKFCTSTL